MSDILPFRRRPHRRPARARTPADPDLERIGRMVCDLAASRADVRATWQEIARSLTTRPGTDPARPAPGDPLAKLGPW